MRAVTPANVIAGFQKAGIYPFNPKAIKVPTGDDICGPAEKVSPVTSSSPPQLVTTLSLPLQPSTTSPSSHPVRTPPQPTLTSEQIARFEQRYEEGYDLYDADYISWLECQHPDAVPSDRHLLVTASTPIGRQESASILDAFSSVIPCTPIPVVDEVPKSSESVQTPETPGTSSNALSRDSSVERHHSSQASSSSSLSKFLVHPTTSALRPKDPRKNWGARVITSAENLAM